MVSGAYSHSFESLLALTSGQPPKGCPLFFIPMSILTRLLEKRGVQEKDLSGEEKVQFDTWKKTLSEGDITVESIKGFCVRMIDVIEQKWRDFEYKDKEKLLASHTVYKALLGIIDGPKVEKEQLEKYLLNLINN